MYTLKNKKNLVVFVLIAAMVIIIAAIAISLEGSKNKSEAPGISDQLRTDEMTNEYITQKKIVTGRNGDMIDEAPPLGRVYINGSVLNELDNPINKDALFYVVINVFYEIDSIFTYEGKPLNKWYTDPALVVFNEPYDFWYNNIFLPYDKEMTAAEERGEEHAQGWWKYGGDGM